MQPGQISSVDAVPTLAQSLLNMTVDDLQWYAQIFRSRVPGRKGELIVLLADRLSDPTEIQRLWAQLKPIQKAALADIVHNLGNRYRADMVQARYPGISAPKNPRLVYGFYYGSQARRTEIMPYDIFFCYSYDLGLFIPSDLAAVLRTLASLPPPVVMGSDIEPPALSVRSGSPSSELVHAATESAVFHDLAATLYLIQQGKITVSTATKIPTLPSLRVLQPRLLLGEYLDKPYGRAEDAIRPLALIMLVQAARWATPAVSGGKLELTKAGEALIPGPIEAAHVREAWQRWVKSNLLDELSRIRAIKGQQSRDVRLTKPTERREKLAAVLQETPVGRWVEVSEFLRYIRATGQSPSIERNAESSLKIGAYGDVYFSYGRMSYWDTVVASYIRAVLWEYVATLGMIDIAYTSPEAAPVPFDELYDLLDTPYLSRYDGLHALRLTNLGAYVLGLTTTYTPPEVRYETGPALLRLLPNLDIVIVDVACISLNDRAFLERIGDSQSENVYRLLRERILEAAEQGLTLDQIQRFLVGKTGLDRDEWPQTVRVFFDDMGQRLEAILDGGRMVVLESDDPYLLTELAHNSDLRANARLGTIDGMTVLLIPEERETAIRRQLRKLGYVPKKKK